MSDTITVPRAVLEQALEAIELHLSHHENGCVFLSDIPDALRAALEQPDIETPASVPEGWKLVPVEPTDDMLYDIQEYSHILPPRGRRIWAHMLAAAPQPPTVKDSLTVRQQVEQEPVAWVGVGSVTWDRRQSEKVEKLTRKAQPEYGFVIPLYTHPQPPRQPLTDDEIERLWYQSWGGALPFARAIERIYSIGE